MRDDLSTERRNRRRTEVLNSKLVDELEDAKKLAKRLSLEFEEERKAREVIEEMCNELAKEVEDDRAHAEDVKRDSARAREELEEEKKMLQLAEIWREERVQMKLADAKHAVNDQCARLNELKSELEQFVTSKNRGKAEILEAELLIEAVADAVKMEGTAFEYRAPPMGEDIFAIFEEIQQQEQRCGESPASDAGSPATDIFLGKPATSAGGSGGEDSEWETMSGESEEKERKDTRLCPDIGLPGLEEWSSPESAKRHAGKGMKGCIEWPRGGSGVKQSLKAKLMEARIESEKVQIRHVLKNRT